MSDNRKIAKNTFFLYTRTIIILIVSLYTSRVVLDKLGVEDYGLYNVVGGVVAILSFISGTLSFGTSRFITFELGAGNEEKLKTTFCTSFYANLVIGIIMLVSLETIGLWFVNNKLVIPDARIGAAQIVYQISLATMMINIIQIPYRSVIIAHEHMEVYAYVSIFEAIGKLAVCYLISATPFDKLVNYAMFIAVVQFLATSITILYCVAHFPESKLSKRFEIHILKRIISFSGWNIAANMAESFKLQGIVIIMNMFCQPVVVGAQAFANQVASAVQQFVSNFRIAIDPQVIKLYASQDYEASTKLTLRSTVYTFDLILLLALPCIFIMNTILKIWLVEVPAYCVVFAQWALIQRIPCSIDSSFFTPMVASGRIKNNSLFSLISCSLQLVMLLIVLKLGWGVMWVQYIGMIFVTGYSLLIKPYILYKDVNYQVVDMLKCFWSCLKVFVPSLALSFLIYHFVGETTVLSAIVSFILIMLSVLVCSVVFMDKNDRGILFGYISNRIRHQ